MASPVPNVFFFEPGIFGDVWLTAWGSINPGLTLYEGPVEFHWKFKKITGRLLYLSPIAIFALGFHSILWLAVYRISDPQHHDSLNKPL